MAKMFRNYRKQAYHHVFYNVTLLILKTMWIFLSILLPSGNFLCYVLQIKL